MRNAISCPYPKLFAFLTLVLFAVALILWRAIDTRPPAWDETVHLQLAQAYKEWLLDGQMIDTRWSAIYPPLYHLSLIPSLVLWMPSADRVVLTHVLYLALLIFGMARLSYRFTGAPWMGLMATALFIATPLALHVGRQPLIGFALTAWVVMGMELLLATEGFARRRAVVYFAVWSGLGLMFKPFYAMWLVGPALWCFWLGKRQSGRLPWKSALLGIFVTVLVALPYYGWQGIMFFSQAAQLASSQGTFEGDPGFQSLAGWAWYVAALRHQIGALLLVPVIVGCIVTVWTSRRSEGVAFLLVWVLSGYVLFTLNHNKDWRYTMQMLPALMLLTMWWPASWISQRRKRVRVLAAVSCLGVFAWNATTVSAAQTEDWRHDTLLQIMQESRRSDGPLRVAVISNHPYLFPRNLEWSAYKRGMALRAALSFNVDADFDEFVLFKSGDVFSPEKTAQRDELQNARWFNSYYGKIAELPLPDGSEVTLYQRNLKHEFAIDEISSSWLQKKLHESLGRLIGGNFNVSVESDADSLQQGRVDRLTIMGGPWDIKGIPVENGQIVLSGASFNLYALNEQAGIGLRWFEDADVCLKLGASTLSQWLRAKQLKLPDATFDMTKGRVRVAATRSGWPVAAEVEPRLDVSDARAEFVLQRAEIGEVAIPGWLLGRAHVQGASLDGDRGLPARIRIGSITADDQQLQIGCET